MATPSDSPSGRQAERALASERIDDAAAAAGGDPVTLRQVYNVRGMIGPTSRQPFVGPPAQWVDDIVDVVRRFRMNTFAYAAGIIGHQTAEAESQSSSSQSR